MFSKLNNWLKKRANNWINSYEPNKYEQEEWLNQVDYILDDTKGLVEQ